MRLKCFTAAAGAVATLVISLAISASAQASPAQSTVYANIPNPLPAGLSSLGYAATATSEFGSDIRLAGTAREHPTITVLMDPWACEQGGWTTGCTTEHPDEGYKVPTTLHIYEVGPGLTVGAELGKETIEQEYKWVPSSDCSEVFEEKTYHGYEHNGECVFGVLTPVVFHPALASPLPNEVIVSVSFNREGSIPAESLNLALNGPAAVGSTPREAEGVYWNSLWYGLKKDEFAFASNEKEAGEWVGYQPAIDVEASNPPVEAKVEAGVPETVELTGCKGNISLGPFIAGVEHTYTNTCALTATSTATESVLTAEDQSGTDTGHLMQGGAYELAQPLEMSATAAVGSSSGLKPLTSPATLLSFAEPFSDEGVTVGFSQEIGAKDALHTGTYAKTITLTLSSTTP